MTTSKRLTQVLKTSKEIDFDDSSKIIIMSDCHRGNNNNNDNFAKNQNLFFAALQYYLAKNYTYIEIGDGDELWENRYLRPIIANHSHVFWLMSKFYKKGKFYMLFGNHDIVKTNKHLRDNILSEYYDNRTQKYMPLFPHIEIPEGLILKHKETGNKILLIHGHQGDFLNDTYWEFARTLVRYVWGPLELIGVQNPTSTSTNDKKKSIIEQRLINWTIKNQQMVIAGHTHKPVFPKVGEHLYFNDGCCTHPRCITGIEITDGSISLIKWSIKTRKDRTLYIGKEILEGPTKLKDYFRTIKRKDCY